MTPHERIAVLQQSYNLLTAISSSRVRPSLFSALHILVLLYRSLQYSTLIYFHFINVLHAFLQGLKMPMFLLFNATVDRHRQVWHLRRPF